MRHLPDGERIPLSKKEKLMTINEYQKLAMTTLNPALSERDVLINAVMRSEERRVGKECL